ncbi:MAG: hypothetical protein QOI98_1957, partial [Solirubrobacteraceae bacterium]|nr:hypothetical protein [Solirubrobacteraceae bacterium]
DTFYTNLYRVLTMPSLFDDADGRYLGFDDAVHNVAPGEHHYTNFSLWDTYRTQTPLLTLIEPRLSHDLAQSLLSDADQNHGVVPRWTQANIDRGIMGGDSGTATLAEFVAAGALDHAGSQHAYDVLLHQATAVPPVWPRSHMDDDTVLGYVPAEDSDIAASLTQEYAIDDAALAGVARQLGDDAGAAMLEQRAGNWRNLMDPDRKFIRPRNRDGSWANPTSVGPLTTWDPDFSDGYQEETGWQALWVEPHDVAGLAQAMGGRSVALQRLQNFFTAALQHPASPVVPVVQQYSSFFGIYYIGNQFTPANETDLATPWFFNWLGQPWQTQKVARAELNVYNSRPDGLPGNDDTGTMSAWYVLASLGIYHAAPGSNAWEVSSPAFARAVVKRGTQGPLTIEAPGATSQVPYIHGANLDGVRLDRTYLSACELQSARTLAYTLSATPDKSWGTGAGAAPPSLSVPSSRALARACVRIPAA